MPELENIIENDEITDIHHGLRKKFTYTEKSWFYYFIKRSFDIIASLIAIIILSPFLIIFAILVKVTSRGPVFFKQPRMGKNGKTFQMLKFRSMFRDAEERLESLKKELDIDNNVMLFKLKDDPRITKLGKFLRKFSIDELPQLFNVFGGSMTIVGPRPALEREAVNYDDYQKNRLMVKQGLTCYWQILGKNNLTFEEQVYLDLKYINNRSILVDLSIILRTIPVVLFGRSV